MGDAIEDHGGQRVEENEREERQSSQDKLAVNREERKCSCKGEEEVRMISDERGQEGKVSESKEKGIGKHGSNASPIRAKPPWPDRGNNLGDSEYC